MKYKLGCLITTDDGKTDGLHTENIPVEQIGKVISRFLHEAIVRDQAGFIPLVHISIQKQVSPIDVN